MELSLQNLHFVAVWIRDESHFDFLPGRESRAPVFRPNFDTLLLQAVAVAHDIFHTDSSVHQIFRKLDFEIRGVAELQEVIISIQIKERQLVSGRGFICSACQRKTEVFIKCDSGIEVAHPNSGVKKLDHSEGKFGATTANGKRLWDMRNILLTVIAQSLLFLSITTAQETKPVHDFEADIKKIVKSTTTGDADFVISMTHPAIFKVAGGKEGFEATTKQVIAMLQEQGFQIESHECGKPTEIHDAGDQEICFIPQKSVMSFGDKKVKSENYMIAARKKPDGKWLYLDGSGLRQNPDALWMLFPDLPKSVKPPKQTMEVVE